MTWEYLLVNAKEQKIVAWVLEKVIV